MAFVFYFVKQRLEARALSKRHGSSVEGNGLNVNDTAVGNENEDINNRITINKKLFAIPAALDLVENVLTNISMTMIAASIVQMMRSSIFVYCAILGMFYLKKKLYRQHGVSMFLIITGVVLVGLKKLLEKDQGSGDYSSTDIIIGLVLVQIGQMFGSVAYITEEKFMGD